MNTTLYNHRNLNRNSFNISDDTIERLSTNNITTIGQLTGQYLSQCANIRDINTNEMRLIGRNQVRMMFNNLLQSYNIEEDNCNIICHYIENLAMQHFHDLFEEWE